MAEEQNSDPILDHDEIIKTFDDVGNLAKTAKEKGGEVANALKNFQDKNNLHPQAVAMCRKIHGMSSERFQDFRRTFDGMYEAVCNHHEGQGTRDMLEEAGE